MHEASIVANVLEIVLEAARQADAREVRSVRLRIGVLAGIDPHALRFSFEAARAGTPAASARLEIEQTPAVLWCGPCDSETIEAEFSGYSCPRCGAAATEIRSGRELEVVSIEID